jgi:NitT/TauT family transport system permease protein
VIDRGQRRRAFEPYAIGVGAVSLFVAAWWLYARFGGASRLIIVPPTDVAAAAIDAFATGRIWPDIGTSALEYLLGSAAAAAFAIPIGLAAGMSRTVNQTVQPFFVTFYVTPRIALLPLLFIWIGVGIELKVVLIALSAFFPLVLSIIAGVQSLSADVRDVTRSFGASRLFFIWAVVLPGIVPFIVTGFRFAGLRALVAMVTAELYASNQGIGYLMINAGTTYHVAELIFLVFLLMAGALALEFILIRLDRAFSRWRAVPVSI